MEETENRTYEEKTAIMDFVAKGFSHEIRNLLAVIKSNAQFCLKYYPDNKELRESLEEIIGNVNLADELTGKYLTQTKPKHQPKPNCINDIIKKACNLLKTYLDQRGLKVSFRKSRHIPKSNIDNVKLEQVFVNLLLNSMEALKKGGAISISSSFERKTNNIIIRFRDNGKGIPQKYIKKVFDTSFSMSKGGKGLGLAICKHIIDLHGGKIFAENIKDKGTQITIQLSLQKTNCKYSVKHLMG